MSANIIRLLPDEERALLECYVAGSQHPASFQQLFDTMEVPTDAVPGSPPDSGRADTVAPCAGQLASMGGDNEGRRACDQSPKVRTAQGRAVAVQSAPSLRDQLGDKRPWLRMAGGLSRDIRPWLGDIHFHREQRR